MTNPIMTSKWFDLLTDVCVAPTMSGVWRRKHDSTLALVRGYYAGGWVWYITEDGPNTQQTFDGFIRDFEQVSVT